MNTFESDFLGDEPFFIGETVLGYEPSKKEIKNMLFLVAYDIRDPKRLRQTAKICENYGLRVECSVFECDLDEKKIHNFWQELKRTIDEEDDAILAYRICRKCIQKIESMGTVIRPCKPTLYFI
ncbi:MAG: CRISPR-associated endonuclease Cas2 [Verrucomicrobiota bacterium]|nr:CRISPR-associated endonuclease Cas2 [Verrucomicrobiota bacterium]